MLSSGKVEVFVVKSTSCFHTMSNPIRLHLPSHLASHEVSLEFSQDIITADGVLVCKHASAQPFMKATSIFIRKLLEAPY